VSLVPTQYHARALVNKGYLQIVLNVANKEVPFLGEKQNSNTTMARRDRHQTHKQERDKANDGECIEKKTEVLSSQIAKSNNKTDSDSISNGSKKELKMTFEFLSKHIHECVKKEMKKNRKRKHKKYTISSSSDSSDSDTSSSDSDNGSDSSKSESELKYKHRKKHRKDSRRKSRKRKQKRKSKHSRSNSRKKGNSSEITSSDCFT